MKTLHDIPKEIIISEEEKRGFRYLYSLGYIRFRPDGQGRYEVFASDPDRPSIPNINVSNFGGYAVSQDIQFDPSWIVRR